MACRKGYIASDRTDYVIIPEPFGREHVCVGHRGVYWFKVTARGRMAHGSMPCLGINAIERITPVLEALVDTTKVLSLVLLESVGEH